jgi:hypothetical protein
MNCVQSNIQGAVDVVCVKLICQNVIQYIFHYYCSPTLRGTELQVTLPPFEFLQNYLLRVYSDSVCQRVADNVTTCTVRTGLQTDVFSDTNSQKNTQYLY